MSFSTSLPATPALHLHLDLRQLKRRARELQRREGLAHCAALDRVARAHGYASWSLLAAKAGPQPRRRAAGTGELLQPLRPGESLLLGSRPGHGKTAHAIALASAALRHGLPCWFFSLANDATDVTPLFAACGGPEPRATPHFAFHHSDELCASRILALLRGHVAPRSVAIIDYLQLLDQRRSSPELQQQVQELTTFARESGCNFVFLSQLRSELDAQPRAPRPGDIRLPNALDLRLFEHLLLLQGGRERWYAVNRGTDGPAHGSPRR